MTTPAGWYHGEGDAPGTVRYWNGSEWVGPAVEQASAAVTGPGLGPQPSGSFLERLFSKRGRVNRTTYALFLAANFLAGIVLTMVDVAVGTYDEDSGLGLSVILGSLVLFWPSIATGVKRIHDWGSSGWLVVLSIVPFVNFVFLLVLLFKGGNPGPNAYGPQRGPGFGL